MPKLKAGVVGSSGQMGRTLLALIDDNPDIYLASHHNRNIGDELSVLVSKSEVIIDFSSPELMSALIDALNESPKPLLSGTTGHNNFEKLNELAKKTAVLWAPNMSLAANLMIEFAEFCSKHLDNFEAHVSEMHHAQKKDSPSGTALRLREMLKKHSTQKKVEISSARLGETPGKHSFILTSGDEILEITHTALNRRAFARGALKAAQFVANAPPGLYSMKDVLECHAY